MGFAAGAGDIQYEKIRPLLRWAGGKQRLVARLLPFCPVDYARRRYIEPFLGAASLFLTLRPKHALLADANPHLIGAYKQIRDKHLEVARALVKLAGNDSKKQYYEVRDIYNRTPRASALQAARFLYLNRTCFNGVFRVNRKGIFNVPYGDKDQPWFPDRADLANVARELRRSVVQQSDYRATLRLARKNDFVYIDPPYPALNGTSFFTHYTMDRFGVQDQIDLAEHVHRLDRLGCLVMMSNADTPLIRTLYGGFAIRTLDVKRSITCKAVRHTVREVVITNYPVTGRSGGDSNEEERRRS